MSRLKCSLTVIGYDTNFPVLKLLSCGDTGQERARRRPGRGSAPSLSCILTTEGSFLYHPTNHAVYIILTSVVSGRYSTKQPALTEYLHEDFSVFRHRQPRNPCLTVPQAAANKHKNILLPTGLLVTTRVLEICIQHNKTSSVCLGDLGVSVWLVSGFCFRLIHYTAGEYWGVPILFVLLGRKQIIVNIHPQSTQGPGVRLSLPARYRVTLVLVPLLRSSPGEISFRKPERPQPSSPKVQLN